MKKPHLFDAKEFKHRQLLEFPIQLTLDFHNRGILDAFDIEEIFSVFLDECLTKNRQYVCIICGTGKFVKPTMYKLLKTHHLVDYFKEGGYYTGGKGAFLVKLK